MAADASTPGIEQQFRNVRSWIDPRALNPRRFTRLAALARTGRLNRALARGADPSGSAQLALHAAMLSTPAVRTAIADQLDRLIRAGTDPPGGRRSAHPDRGAIIANAETMRTVSTLLRGTTPVYARGTAMLSQLLRDGTGRIYVMDGPTLAACLDKLLAAMLTGEPDSEHMRSTASS